MNVARDLLGQMLMRRLQPSVLMLGRTVETEAYGPGNPAFHAYRTWTLGSDMMFGPPGYLYIQLNEEIHQCLNLVTHVPDATGAVLFRSLEMNPYRPLRDLTSPGFIAAPPVQANPAAPCTSTAHTTTCECKRAAKSP